MMDILIQKFPDVFFDIKDTNGNELIAINRKATLSELFEAYSEIVHYIDGDIITVLENFIRKRIEEIEGKI